MTEEKRGPGRPRKEDTPRISARVLRDYWPTEHQIDRVRKGQIVNVTAEEMIEGLEAGTLERVK